MPEVLRLLRVGLTPGSDFRLHRRAFGCSVGRAIRRALLILVLLVVPRRAGLDLVEVDVLAVRQKDFADQPAV